MSGLRVLFSIHGPADERTAVYRTVSGYAAHLREYGHAVDLLTADDLRWTTPRLDPICLPPALASRKLTRYDVVVFHSYLGGVFHGLRPFIDPGRRTVTVTSFHGLEPLYFRALEEEGLRAGQPLSGRYRLLHGVLMPHLLRATCRASDAVFCLNSLEEKYLVAEGWAQPDRVHVLPNGIEGDGFIAREPRTRLRELLFIGQWLPAKGIRYLVQAFTAIAPRGDVRLTCLGTGAAADVVAAAFPAEVRERVRVVPSAGRAEVYEALRHADVFVFPTLSEGFSKALLEAMAASLPVVATAAGAGADVLRHEHNSLVVPVADAPAVAAAVNRYFDDPPLAARHGAAARATAEGYRLEHACREWARHLCAVVDRHVRERGPVPGRRDVVL
jgi:glycosyltransferase involved in cell wall biosynthesis